MVSANSHLTALSRKTLSRPARWLRDKGLVVGRALDYGGGRGRDASELGMELYDPYYWPTPLEGPYDTITCTFVLNVLPDESERQSVVSEVVSLLTENGNAYFTVRADRKSLNGWTSRGTWQGLIDLPYPMLHDAGTFHIYHARRHA